MMTGGDNVLDQNIDRSAAAQAAPGAGGAPVVSAANLGKVFGSTIAVEDASFEIRKGEFVSIVGPSGCGKSTLLKMIAGLLDRSEGHLAVNGDTVSGPRRDVGVMFQKPTLLEWKTVIENVLLPAKLSGRLGPEDREEAEQLLDLVGLEDFGNAFPQHLSGGMQQRVALARLLKIGADILLLDEPFGALDEFTREHLNLELSRITNDAHRTTVFVTHNISEAIFLADKVFVMTPRPGRLAAVVDVPFERPRDLSLLGDHAFADLVAQVREIFAKGGVQ